MRGSLLPQTLSILLNLLILGGCRAGRPITASTTIPLSATPTPAPTVTSPPTLTPTITTTPVPITEIDFTPSPYQGPLPEGAKAVLGMGVIDDWEISPNGTRLVILTNMDSIALYDIATWKQRWFAFCEARYPCSELRWSPDSSMISILSETAVIVWDAETAKELFTIDLFDYYTQTSIYLPARWNSVEWSPDGKHFAIGSADVLLNDTGTIGSGEIFLIDAATGAIEQRLSLSGESADDLLWSPDGAKLSAHVREKTSYNAEIWDIATTGIIRTIDNAQITAWSPDCQTIIVWIKASESDEHYEVWNTGSDHQPLAFSDSEPVISPDGARIAVNDGNTTHILDTRTGALLQVLEHSDLSPESLGWSTDNTMLVVSGARMGQVWNVNTGQLLFSMDAYYLPATQIWSPDSKLLIASAGSGDEIATWNVETGAPIRALLGHEWMSPQFLPGSNVLILLRSSNLLGLWNAQTGEMLHQIVGAPIRGSSDTGPFDLITAWSEDGTHIVLKANGPAGIWDIATGSFVAPLTSSQSKRFVSTGEVDERTSPDGMRYVELETTGIETFVILGDAATDQIVRRIPLGCGGGEGGYCASYRWSANGQLLAIDIGSSLRIYKADTGALVSVKSSPWPIDSVSFSPDNKQIAATTVGGVVIVWEVP